MTASRKTRRYRRDPRRRQTIAGLAGLVVLAALGWLSYSSSDGLPWQSGYELRVEVANADRLAPGNEVAIGGTRVGRVAEVEAVAADRDRAAYASVTVELDDAGDGLPSDSSASVRPSSVLGASYLELRPGSSTERIADGGLLPLEQSERATQLTDLFEVFDRTTARNLQRTLKGLGGLAGRGTALNDTIGSLAEGLPRLERVSRSLARGETRLGELIEAYARVADELGPAGGELAGLVRGGARTLGAAASEGDSITATLEALAPAEVAATAALTSLRPALDSLAAAMTDLRPAGPLLVPAVAEANAALKAGVPAMDRVPRLADDLRSALRTLRRVTGDPATDGGLRKLTEAMDAGGPLIDTLRAGQVNCNAFTLWARNLGDLWGGTGAGSGPSHALIGLGIAQMGAVGEFVQSPGPAVNVGMNYVSNNDDDECEAGNEPYDGTQAIGNPPGLQPSATFDSVADPAALRSARQAGLLARPPWEGGR